MKKLEHIGIAVSDLRTAEALFERLLGTTVYREETVSEAGVRVAFLRAGAAKVELLEPLSVDTPLHRFLENRGPGLHHLAFSVEDIGQACQHMQAQGFQPLSDKPQLGAENKQVCFFHPKTTGGVLIELCQAAESKKEGNSEVAT